MTGTEPVDEREAAFLATIRPMLEIIARKCVEMDMPLSAMVEVNAREGDYATVFSKEEGGVSLNTFMVRSCMNAAPNIDAFVIGMMKFCKANNIDTSGSIVMRLMENQPRH